MSVMSAPLAFLPHPLIRGGHLQTLAAVFMRQKHPAEQALQRVVALDDGDQLVLHDDCPADWKPGDRAALLIHGLAGNHSSPYMRRIAGKLRARGLRTFRMDLRGCGAGIALARYPYHSGRSPDAAAALRAISALCPGSSLSLIGFSLGGNITLKLLGEDPKAVPSELKRAVAVCPPVDLKACVESLRRGVNRLYDRYFARLLRQQVAERQRVLPETIVPAGWPGSPADPGAPSSDSRRTNGQNGTRPALSPRGVAEFDEAFTAPVCGFGTADNYYRLSSSAQFVPAIQVPTLILAAADDPLVPGVSFERLDLPADVTLQITRHGGHLGYLARHGTDPDRRWMDWRVVDWCYGP